jgi:acetyl-CoA carboxylase carboxyltransferase component
LIFIIIFKVISIYKLMRGIFEMPDTKRMTAAEVFDTLFDNSSYSEISAGYGNTRAVYGYANGSPVLCLSLDGAMDFATSEKIVSVLDFAAKSGMPVVSVLSSAGAYASDGQAVFGYYGKILKKVSALSGVVPMIAIADGVVNGSLAVIAGMSDILIAVQSSQIYAVVDAETDTANSVIAVKTADMAEAVKTAADLIEKLPSNNIAQIPEFEADIPETIPAGDAKAVIGGLSDKDSVIELYADMGKASLTAFATVGGAIVGFAATNKTSDLLTCDDCEKIEHFVSFCDAFSIPVVTVLDTAGFDKSCSVKSIVKLTSVYANASTRKVTLITGQALGTVLSVFISANADAVYAYDTAVIAPLLPLTAAEFLHHDELKGAKDLKVKRDEIAAEYAASMSAENASSAGLLTAVITPETAYKTLSDLLDTMQSKREAGRYDRKHAV